MYDDKEWTAWMHSGEDQRTQIISAKGKSGAEKQIKASLDCKKLENLTSSFHSLRSDGPERFCQRSTVQEKYEVLVMKGQDPAFHFLQHASLPHINCSDNVCLRLMVWKRGTCARGKKTSLYAELGRPHNFQRPILPLISDLWWKLILRPELARTK